LGRGLVSEIFGAHELSFAVFWPSVTTPLTYVHTYIITWK